MDSPIRYAVIGLGRSGWNIHVNAIRPRAHAKLATVVDSLEERRLEAVNEFGCKAYETSAPMLEQDDVDVVVVATPSVFHAPDSVRALKAGKHVICEKPMAMNLREADEMIAQAEAANRQLFIHQNYRFTPIFRHLREVVDSGILGKLYHIRNYNQDFSRRDDWQTLAKNGGGVLFNKCSHNLDMIMQLLGAKVVDVMGDLQQIVSGGDVEDHVKAFIRAENGCTADMEVTSAQNVAGKLPVWMLCGTHGTLTSDGRQSVIRWFDPNEVSRVEVIDGAARNRAYGSQAPPLPWQEKTVEAKGPGIGNFYDNVEAVLLRNEEMFITPASVREVMRVMAEIRKGTPFDVAPFV